MKTLLNTNQVELGNIVRIERGSDNEAFEARVIGGAYGRVTKYWLIDTRAENILLAEAKTIAELLEGYTIYEIITCSEKVFGEQVTEEQEVLNYCFLFVVQNGELKVRRVVGGKLSTELSETEETETKEVFFAIDPETGNRRSLTFNSIQAVVDSYEDEVKMILNI